MAASEENAKVELVKQDFKDRIQPIMVSIKKEIEDSKNNNQQKKSIKMSSMLEILTPLTEEYIEDIIRQKLIGRELLEKVRAVIHTTLVDELSNNISSNTSHTSSDKMKKLEQFAGQYGLNDEDALSQAIKASLGESTDTLVKPMNISPVSPASEKQKVLRSITKIVAKIGTGPETSYSVNVYEPTVSKGGKRKTKKAKRAKKQKTKKLKKRAV
jgi:predicted RecB family endonuclease